MLNLIRAIPILAALAGIIWILGDTPPTFWRLAGYALGAELGLLLVKLGR